MTDVRPFAPVPLPPLPADGLAFLAVIADRLTLWQATLDRLDAAVEPHADGSKLRSLRRAGGRADPAGPAILPTGPIGAAVGGGAHGPAAVVDEALAAAVAGLAQIHHDRDAILDGAVALGVTATSVTAVVAELADRLPVAARPAAVDLRAALERTSARLDRVRSRSLTAWVLARRAVLHNGLLLKVLTEGETPRMTYARPQGVTSHGALVNRCA